MSDTTGTTDPPPLPDPSVEPPLTLELVAAMIAEGVKAAAEAGAANAPVPVWRPGTVKGVDPAARTASVLVDGDTEESSAQVITELPYVNARVMIEFVPPSSVFLVGFAGPCGIPPGVEMDYAGPITHDADAANATPTANQPPPGFLWCHGQAVSRSTYAALFAAIGTTYGAGDGATTFNVPDKRGRLSIPLDDMGGTDAGRLAMANTLGGTGGSNTISQAQLPNVNFTVSGGSVSGSVTINDPGHHHNLTDTMWTSSFGGFNYTTGGAGAFGIANPEQTQNATTGITASLSGATYSGGTAASGGSGAEALPPYMLCHRIIKT